MAQLAHDTKEGSGKKGRITNIECLRCIAMLFIALNHSILYIAKYQMKLDTTPVNFLLTDFIYPIVYNGVNIFVLISGYFLVKTTRSSTNWEKVARLWLSMLFYSVIIYVCAIAFHYKTLNVQELVHTLMPIRYNAYWFMTQYIGLYILSPFLAKWARAMSRKEYQTMLISFFILASVIQLQGLKGGFSLVWFLFLFMFAGYMQLWEHESNAMKKWSAHAGTMFMATSLLLFVLSLLVNGKQLNIVSYWGFYNGPLLFVSSVSFFLFFRKVKESRAIRVISRLSPYMLGVYLIHEQPILKQWLWAHLNRQFAEVQIYELFYIAIAILLIGALIEYLRQAAFKTLKIDTLFYAAARRLILPVVTIWKSKRHQSNIR